MNCYERVNKLPLYRILTRDNRFENTATRTFKRALHYPLRLYSTINVLSNERKLTLYRYALGVNTQHEKNGFGFRTWPPDIQRLPPVSPRPQPLKSAYNSLSTVKHHQQMN